MINSMISCMNRRDRIQNHPFTIASVENAKLGKARALVHRSKNLIEASFAVRAA
jgi:hypothetical protein